MKKGLNSTRSSLLFFPSVVFWECFNSKVFFHEFWIRFLRNLDRKNASEFLDNIWTFSHCIVPKEYARSFQIIIRRLNRSSDITGIEKRYIYIIGTMKIFSFLRDVLTCSSFCLQDENCHNFAVSKVTGQCLSVSNECLLAQLDLTGLTF